MGDGSGYPAMSVIHPMWQPPTPGTTPTMKVASASDVARTHAAIGRLSDRLQATLVAHYILRWPMEEQAAVLECEPATVYARVERAHVELRRVLMEGAPGFLQL